MVTADEQLQPELPDFRQRLLRAKWVGVLANQAGRHARDRTIRRVEKYTRKRRPAKAQIEPARLHMDRGRCRCGHPVFLRNSIAVGESVSP